MKSSGLIVEYNPFHNGHLYHLNKSRAITNADCMIAIMSGPFLQRGEPAIVDKFTRTKAALSAGVDIVLELPFPFAVQSSQFFATGALATLNKLGVTTISFGSESGNISHFIESESLLRENKMKYDTILQSKLKSGLAFPAASQLAYEAIGMDAMNIQQANNILGLSYVQAIKSNQLEITPVTIKRKNNEYHEPTITGEITSATSIRNSLMKHQNSLHISHTLPATSLTYLNNYKLQMNRWHNWEDYFQLLYYKVMTSTPEQLALIHGVDEGIEHRIKRTANTAKSFAHWVSQVKTKRYTLTRIQRIFTHILTNTSKAEINEVFSNPEVPYIRLLGMNTVGQKYLNENKHKVDVPIITNLNKRYHSLTFLDERAQHTYNSIFDPAVRDKLFKQEFSLPIISGAKNTHK